MNKKVWYKRDEGNSYDCPFRVFMKPPKHHEAGFFREPREVASFDRKTFKVLFGFIPRKGERGQIEIKIKRIKYSGKEPGRE